MSYFRPAEFTCRCGRATCEAPTTVVPLLLERLNLMRSLYGQPLIVTSGLRCPPWNQSEGGEDNSEHLIGTAADLRCPGSRARYHMIRAAFLAGFTRLGVGATFLHVGVSARPEHPAEVVWTYPGRARA